MAASPSSIENLDPGGTFTPPTIPLAPPVWYVAPGELAVGACCTLCNMGLLLQLIL